MINDTMISFEVSDLVDEARKATNTIVIAETPPTVPTRTIGCTMSNFVHPLTAARRLASILCCVLGPDVTVYNVQFLSAGNAHTRIVAEATANLKE